MGSDMSFKLHVTGPISSTSSLPTSSQVLCQEQSHTLSSTMPSAKSSTKSSATWSRTKSKIPSGGRGPQSLAISAESCGRNSCKHSEAARTRWWRPQVPWKGPAQSLLANSAASCGAGSCSTQRGWEESHLPHVPPAPRPAGEEPGRRLKPRRVPPDRWVLDRMGRVSMALFIFGSSPSRARAGETAQAAAVPTRPVGTRLVVGVAMAPPVPSTASGVLIH